jgi:MYXO-CTERM domain-containing protein
MAIDCHNHGAPLPDGTCLCNDGFAGTSCDRCASGHAGAACEFTDEATCFGHGQAREDGSCACDKGYTGADCTQCASGYGGYPACTPLPIVPNVPDASTEPQDGSTDATLPVQSTPLDAALPDSSEGQTFDAAGFDGAWRDAGKDAGVSELYRILPADPVTCQVTAPGHSGTKTAPSVAALLAALGFVLTRRRKKAGISKGLPSQASNENRPS